MDTTASASIAVEAAATASTDLQPIIVDRAEFAEVLHRLRRGRIMVRSRGSAVACHIDGVAVHHAFGTLRDHALIERFQNRFGLPGHEYWRITAHGRDFADRVWNHWRAKTRLQRMVMRLTG